MADLRVRRLVLRRGHAQTFTQKTRHVTSLGAEPKQRTQKHVRAHSSIGDFHLGDA